MEKQNTIAINCNVGMSENQLVQRPLKLRAMSVRVVLIKRWEICFI